MSELRLMKGNEALAEAAIRAGVDAYFGYLGDIVGGIQCVLDQVAEHRAQFGGIGMDGG